MRRLVVGAPFQSNDEDLPSLEFQNVLPCDTKQVKNHHHGRHILVTLNWSVASCRSIKRQNGKFKCKMLNTNTDQKYKYKIQIQTKKYNINTKWEIQMCDHQGKVSGLHDLHERGEPEMCNLLMT